jgi:hypothetical protein
LPPLPGVAGALGSRSLRPGVLDARAVLSYAAVMEHGLSFTAVARQVGLSRRSIGRAIARAQMGGLIGIPGTATVPSTQRPRSRSSHSPLRPRQHSFLTHCSLQDAAVGDMPDLAWQVMAAGASPHQLGTLGTTSRPPGTTAYIASVSGATATQGIFRTDGTQTVAIARDDNDTPTGGRFTSLRAPIINERGQVAFEAQMTGGSADFGVFRGEGGDLTSVFVANQIAPGGATFEDFGEQEINRHGRVATFASLTNSASQNGLFVGDGTDAVAIALEGQAAPKGGSYRDRSGRGITFPSPFRLNDRGEVAFDASLTGGTSVSGIFRSNGERTTTIALAGTMAPGTTGTFESFGDIKLGNDGRVALIATMAIGVGGVDSSNNMGIWIGTSDEDLQLVVRTGEVIGGKVLTLLPIFGFAFGNQFDMNENGVLWIGNFGFAKATVFSRILGENDDGDIPS